MEAKVISRGTGCSAVAASAYMNCFRLYNDYDGVQHDYTRKQGLVWQQVFLPDMAPAEWADREVLWNAVEKTEKTKDSRLARKFVADGMCADVCIHDTDGHNPHAHIMLTVRPLTKDGKWQNKTEKEYLCVRDGEERGFTAAGFKAAQADGWEKQYQCGISAPLYELYEAIQQKIYNTTHNYHKMHDYFCCSVVSSA